MAGKAALSPESGRVATWPYYLFAIAAGAMLPIQFGINAQLASWIGSPLRATLVALILAGQALASLTVDHFGLVGFQENTITFTRLLGIGLVAAGVVLVRGL